MPVGTLKRRKRHFPESYSIEQVIFAVQHDHPDWDTERVLAEARRIYSAIRALDMQELRSNRRFYAHEIPSGLDPQNQLREEEEE